MTRDEAMSAILAVLQAMKLVSEDQKRKLLTGSGDDISLATLGIDSMAVVDLCVGLEDKIGREVQVEELVENPTVRKLAHHFSSDTS